MQCQLKKKTADKIGLIVATVHETPWTKNFLVYMMLQVGVNSRIQGLGFNGDKAFDGIWWTQRKGQGVGNGSMWEDGVDRPTCHYVTMEAMKINSHEDKQPWVGQGWETFWVEVGPCPTHTHGPHGRLSGYELVSNPQGKMIAYIALTFALHDNNFQNM